RPWPAGTQYGDERVRPLRLLASLNVATAEEKSARREFFYYDETDLMGLRVDNWKLSFGVKQGGTWWDPKSYPSVPFVFNLRMDPMEKMDRQVHSLRLISKASTIFRQAKVQTP